MNRKIKPTWRLKMTRTNKKIISKLILILSIVLIAGCRSKSFTYPEIGTLQTKEASLVPFTNKTVVVLPFNDNRPKIENLNLYFLYMIPIAPFGYGKYEYPEKATWFTSIGSFDFNPSIDVARAASTNFQNSKLFKDVIFSNTPGEYKSDYTLEGEINSLLYTGRRFSYGTSYFSYILWTLGAPMGTSFNCVSITLYLKDKNQNILWQYSSEEEDYKVQWIYKPYNDCSMYAELTNKAMKDAITNLYNKIRNNPAFLKQ
jgi:hypothetical protein